MTASGKQLHPQTWVTASEVALKATLAGLDATVHSDVSDVEVPIVIVRRPSDGARSGLTDCAVSNALDAGASVDDVYRWIIERFTK